MRLPKKNDGLFVDQFHPYWAVNYKKLRDAGEKGRITAGDAVHPGPAGQALMAASILKALGFPTEVSSLTINTGTAKQSPMPAATVTWLTLWSRMDGVSFKRKDFVLPFFPEQAKSILKWTPLLEDMNQYILKVTGLAPGKYDVKLGGKKVATYTDKELARFVNLAEPALGVGPVADQVKDIVKAITEKTNYYHDQIYSPLVLNRSVNAKNPDFKEVAPADYAKHRDALIAERLKKMPEFDAAVRKALEPRPHLVEIVPSK